jgi:hypothetical protein
MAERSSARDVPPPSWGSVLACLAFAAAIPVVLWVAGDPVARGLVVASAVVALASAPRAARVLRCVARCREFTFVLGGGTRVTVTRPTGETR